MAETTSDSSSPDGDDRDAPVAPSTQVAAAGPPTYTATPYAGATVPYDAPATPVEVVERPRRRRGLLIGGLVAAALLVVGLSFGGGVALGAHLGAGAGAATVQGGGFPGGTGPGGDGTRPEPPSGGFGDQQNGQSGQSGDSQNGTGQGS